VAIGTAVFILVGVVLVMPAVLGPFSWIATRVFFPRRPAVAALARRQVLRHRSRSALTVGVLFVASATGIGLGCTILDNIQDVENWHTREIAGDFVVRAMLPSAVDSMGTPLPLELGEEIRRIPGVTKVGAACFASAEIQAKPDRPDEKMSVVIIVRDFAKDAQLYLNLVGQNEKDVRDGLYQGGVVIGTVVAQRTGLRAGDEVTVSTSGKTQRLRIVGLTNEYLNAGLTVHIWRDYARKYFGIDTVDTFVVVAEPDAVPEVGARLEALCKKHGVILQTISEISQMISKLAGGIRAGLWGILALGFIVAAFGVVNTLTMNMLEQTREFGLLRAVAMTRRQVRRTILAQAAILAGVGLVPGSASGILTAYLINLATMAAVGHPVAFGLHPVMVVGSLVAGFLIVLAAALIPAQRAARLNLLIALQYE
jgi:putative ABC transport system permease protein